MRYAALLILLVLSGCGSDNGENNPCAPEMRVYHGGTFTCGEACPAGALEAYREDFILVCHQCQEPDVGCAVGETCSADCGPGCEDDTGGCCMVLECRS